MCEACESNIISEAILWLCLIIVSFMIPIIPTFISIYFFIGFIVFLVEMKFEIAHFFYGCYFPFEVGIFIGLYPLIFAVNIFTYYMGEEVAPPCPYCGEVVWHSIRRRGKIYGKCKICNKEFII